MIVRMDIIREVCASQAHLSWSHLMTYIFSKCKRNSDGSLTIPPEMVKRWQRQIGTNYIDLTEREKDSDRKEADKYIELIRTLLEL